MILDLSSIAWIIIPKYYMIDNHDHIALMLLSTISNTLSVSRILSYDILSYDIKVLSITWNNNTKVLLDW